MCHQQRLTASPLGWASFGMTWSKDTHSLDLAYLSNASKLSLCTACELGPLVLLCVCLMSWLVRWSYPVKRRRMLISQGDGFDLGLDVAFEVLATKCCAYFYYFFFWGGGIVLLFSFWTKDRQTHTSVLTQLMVVYRIKLCSVRNGKGIVWHLGEVCSFTFLTRQLSSLRCVTGNVLQQNLCYSIDSTVCQWWVFHQFLNSFNIFIFHLKARDCTAFSINYKWRSVAHADRRTMLLCTLSQDVFKQPPLSLRVSIPCSCFFPGYEAVSSHPLALHRLGTASLTQSKANLLSSPWGCRKQMKEIPQLATFTHIYTYIYVDDNTFYFIISTAFKVVITCMEMLHPLKHIDIR